MINPRNVFLFTNAIIASRVVLNRSMPGCSKTRTFPLHSVGVCDSALQCAHLICARTKNGLHLLFQTHLMLCSATVVINKSLETHRCEHVKIFHL